MKDSAIKETPFIRKRKLPVHIFSNTRNMSIYLAVQNSGVQNPIFAAQGRTDLMPSAMSDVPVYAFPKYFHPNLLVREVSFFIVPEKLRSTRA
jgi:hypothetical protein